MSKLTGDKDISQWPLSKPEEAASEQRVKAVYDDAQAVWTSRGWRVLASIPGIGVDEIGRTSSGHVPECDAWNDAASKLPTPHQPTGEAAPYNPKVCLCLPERDINPRCPIHNSPEEAAGEVSLPPVSLSEEDKDKATYCGTEPYGSLSTIAKMFIFCRERQLLAALRELQRLRDNPRVGDCCICGGSIWAREARITDDRGTFHPMCAVTRQLDEAKVELQRVREELEAMTEDRNLWRDEHNGDCPNLTRANELEAELRRREGEAKEI